MLQLQLHNSSKTCVFSLYMVREKMVLSICVRILHKILYTIMEALSGHKFVSCTG